MDLFWMLILCVGALLLGVLCVLSYSGFFYTYSIRCTIPASLPKRFAYTVHVGPYSGVSSEFWKLAKIAPKKRHFGVYYDDPKTVNVQFLKWNELSNSVDSSWPATFCSRVLSLGYTKWSWRFEHEKAWLPDTDVSDVWKSSRRWIRLPQQSLASVCHQTRLSCFGKIHQGKLILLVPFDKLFTSRNTRCMRLVPALRSTMTTWYSLSWSLTRTRSSIFLRYTTCPLMGTRKLTRHSFSVIHTQ